MRRQSGEVRSQGGSAKRPAAARAAAGTQTRGRDRATMATGVNSLDWHGSVMLPVSLQGFTPPWSIRRNPLPALSLKAGRSRKPAGVEKSNLGKSALALG